MAEPMSPLSPQKLNTIMSHDMDETVFHDPPSSPFVSYIDTDQENAPPADVASPPKFTLPAASTPQKPDYDLDEDGAPPTASKIASPIKMSGLRSRNNSVRAVSPIKQQLAEEDDLTAGLKLDERGSPRKSPVKSVLDMERPSSAQSNRSRRQRSPTKDSISFRTDSTESIFRPTESESFTSSEDMPLSQDAFVEHREETLRMNEGLTITMNQMMESRTTERYESSAVYNLSEFLDNTNIENSNLMPEGPECSELDVDDTRFSTFSEMPTLNMTKFASLKQSPKKDPFVEQETPRARAQMTPGTSRRGDRTPSPTPRRGYKENDTTNLLLDFTAQIEAFSGAARRSPVRNRSPDKGADRGLLSYIQSQRSPAKGGAFVPQTPAEKRQLINLLDFELPPPPTPRSVPTVTIRELESLKANFQSQISSLSASLSGKEAEVESLAKAVSNAERRVGEAQEAVREERSAREHAEAQMTEWKKKGEEVQELLQNVQTNLNRMDEEREVLLAKLAAAEHRAEEAEARVTEAEARAVEAEHKNVDTTTFVDLGKAGEKQFTEEEVQNIVAEKVNEVARDLHAAYKAKHEKKIAALKGNYQRKSDEKIKEYKDQVKKLEKEIEDLHKDNNTFSKVLPPGINADAAAGTTSNPEDKKRLEEQQTEIENQRAKLAGLSTELTSLRASHADLVRELELERVEKGELVAAAEQMLALCSEKMEEQQEELRKSQIGGRPPAPPHTASAPGGVSGIARPSGLRGPGFGAQPGLSRSTSGGAGKSRLLSNIERMGAMSAASNHGEKE